ncbi:hypothetical protein Q4I32_002600 [Leishmania shawi]|uniref:Uncharacterized protein n=1 Tax=Leishmania shawi TaxID=5680 RepID=A0AAW3C2C8_9TRYP
MNIFQSSSVGFRQGKSLADDATTLSALRYPIPASAPGDGGIRTPLSSGSGASAPAKQSADLPALLAAAQQTRPAAAKWDQKMFPSVPYYGILSRCEVHIDVSIGHDVPTPAWSTSAETGTSVETLLPSPATTMTRMAHIQRCLHDVAERFGAVYHLSTSAALSESVAAPLPPTQGGPSSAAFLHSPMTYGAYVQALHDSFRRLSELRQTCVSVGGAALGASPAAAADGMATHHTFYMRLLGHPSWKDLSALLCVEKGRLLVCLISSSRITQKYLTETCTAAGVGLDWFGGAALMAEPLRLSPGGVNPVWVVWDALVHLPLLSPSSAKREEKVEGRAGGAEDAADTLEDVSAGVREVLSKVVQAGTALSGFNISLISSMPFQGATRCSQVGRITEEAPVFAHEDHHPSSLLATAAAAATPSSLFPTVAKRPTRPAVVARRYVWRLIPSPPPSYLTPVSTSSSTSATLSLSCCAVLPFFMSKLLACLIEECGLISFTVRCGGPVEVTTHLGAPSGSTESTTSRAVGVRLVHSSAPSLLTLQQGPSSSSCLAFSRLSGAAWVDAETREGLSLGGFTTAFGQSDEDALSDAEEDTELEFELMTIRYEQRGRLKEVEEETNKTRVGAAAAVGKSIGRWPVKRARCDAAMTTEKDHNDAFIQPAQWGPSFAFAVAVKRLIAASDMAD